jgi:hypothetical protein
MQVFVTEPTTSLAFITGKLSHPEASLNIAVCLQLKKVRGYQKAKSETRKNIL